MSGCISIYRNLGGGGGGGGGGGFILVRFCIKRIWIGEALYRVHHSSIMSTNLDC